MRNLLNRKRMIEQIGQPGDGGTPRKEIDRI